MTSLFLIDLRLFSVAVTRSRDVPSFGPPIPKGVTFPKSNVFRDFLLAKVINAENAAHKSEKFRAMATRTRQEYLKDLAEKNVTNTPIDPSGKFPFISLASKKKEKSKPYPGAELSSMGAIVWAVRAKDYNKAMEIDCLLGVSSEFIVLIEQETKSVVFNCSCRDVIGWTSTDASLKIFYERGECVSVESFVNNDDIKEIVKRLQVSVFLPLPFHQAFHAGESQVIEACPVLLLGPLKTPFMVGRNPEFMGHNFPSFFSAGQVAEQVGEDTLTVHLCWKLICM